MKTRHVLSSTGAVAAIGAAAVLSTSGGAAASAGRSVHITMEQTSMKLVDAAPEGDSPGDLGVIAGDVLNPGGGKRVGRYQGYCILVAPATGNSECTFTLKLPRGQITILGGYGKGINAGDVVHEAVVGGTGAYRDARGQTTGRETGDTSVDVRIALDR
jgi:hypothetical protein